MKHFMRQMSGTSGDHVAAEWDTEQTAADEMKAFEKQFKDWVAHGGVAADLGTDELIKEFRPDTDILLIPRIQGGSGPETGIVNTGQGESQRGITDEQIENWFTYHSDPADVPKYAAINEAAKAFARVVRDQTPICADQSAAMRLIRDARMTANAAIACKGR